MSALTRFSLVRRSLTYHWRSHLGVFLGVVTATAVLSGALMVGDSVRFTLRSVAEARLGRITHAIMADNRFFRDGLAKDLEQKLHRTTAPVLLLRGAVSSGDGHSRVNGVQVLGVNNQFWKLSKAGTTPSLSSPGAALNSRLASRLGAKVGDEIILRVEKPSILPRDAPLSTVEDFSTASRVTVTAILDDQSLGPFGLQANQVSPPNAFVSIDWLQGKVNLSGKANLTLISGATGEEVTTGQLNQILRETWQLADAGLELRLLESVGKTELRTSRIFLEPAAEHAAMKTVPSGKRYLAYFANELRVGERATPYSIVCGVEGLAPPEGRPLQDNEILINEWLAEDLQAKPGDTLELAYFVIGPMRKLIEQRHSFVVRAVVPIKGTWSDPDLMPDFPGMAGSENCRDWEPGFTIDVEKIRDKDEAYWDQYRGTPKAFVNLHVGQEMWSNRFGNLTAIRFPAGEISLDSLAASLLSNLETKDAGIMIRPVQAEGRSASSQAMDFGGLFLGLSFFLIVAALILVGLLNVLGVERRGEETGVLLAMGFPTWRVRRLLFLEGAFLAILAGPIGALCGLLYTRAVLLGLSTVWSGAMGGDSKILFQVTPATWIEGALMGLLIALVTIALTLRKQFQRPARDLLSNGIGTLSPGKGGKKSSIPSRWVGLCGLALSFGMFILGGISTSPALFFSMGALCLVSTLFLAHAWLVSLETRRSGTLLSDWALSAGNASRRRGRSIAVVALLACGTFLVIAVGANRHDPLAGAEESSSGTGGFSLFGESTLPVLQDMNTEEGCNAFGLSRDDLGGVSFVPFRLREGDDASCLNLNRAQTPNLLGVDPAFLAGRNAFSFSSHVALQEKTSPWLLLDHEEGGDVIPAIVDQATLQWAIQKRIGETLTYISESGHPFQVRFCAALSGSVLQGDVIISEKAFTRFFPSESGYRLFLIDAPASGGSLKGTAELLMKAMEDVGLEVIPTVDRLAAFHTVENTYLAIFQALGALGLMLGSIGLGVVVLRNVLERRAELALLRAVGFSQRHVRRLVSMEHWLLLGWGLACGTVSGFLAVFPHLLAGHQAFPYVSLSLSVFMLLLNGLLWIWGATLLALRGPLLSSLRNE